MFILWNRSTAVWLLKPPCPLEAIRSRKSTHFVKFSKLCRRAETAPGMPIQWRMGDFELGVFRQSLLLRSFADTWMSDVTQQIRRGISRLETQSRSHLDIFGRARNHSSTKKLRSPLVTQSCRRRKNVRNKLTRLATRFAGYRSSIWLHFVNRGLRERSEECGIRHPRVPVTRVRDFGHRYFTWVRDSSLGDREEYQYNEMSSAADQRQTRTNERRSLLQD